MLSHPHHFRGTSYSLPATGQATSSHVNFNFNFLPVLDHYGPPGNPDLRTKPSVARQAVLFDWWERLFDYNTLRGRVRERCCRQLWLLFEEAAQQVHLNQPSTLNQRTEQLLRHFGVNLDVSSLLLDYFATPMKKLTPKDLVDERWPIRVWYADQHIRSLQEAFFTKTISQAMPALWASDDPDTLINGQSGKQNLVQFVQKSLLETDDIPRDIKGIKNINNGLRCRARKAIFAYLCGMSRVSLSPLGLSTSAMSPQDLSDLLLQDVEVGLEERASRIEATIHSVHTFVQRARIGLEPGWTHKLSELWECRLVSFGTWSAFKRRQVYYENWIHWDEIQKQKKFESIQFFTKQLEAGDLSIVERGHPLYWSGGISTPPNDLTQSQELATLQLQHDSIPEGLSLMGTPMRDGRPTLLSPLPQDLLGPPNPGTVPSTGSGGSIAATPILIEPSNHNFKAPESKVVGTSATGIESALSSLKQIPLWITAAIRLGAQFIRVAGASQGPGIPYDGEVDSGGACCDKCGQVHDPCMDEYYFWLADTSVYRYEDVGGSYTGTLAQYIQNADIDTAPGAQVTPAEPDSDWNDKTKLPNLLKWPSRPMVHLFWTRVHMGTLDPPRRSDEGMLIQVPATGAASPVPDLTFSGRISDSLYFPVSNTWVDHKFALN
jgi:hypothetical protein